MKTADEVRNRVVELLSAELDRRVREASERLPHRCFYNRRQPLDARRRVDGDPNEMFNRISAGAQAGRSLPVVQTIGLCMLGAEDPTQWSGSICEDAIDAKRCPDFTPVQSKEGLFAEFTKDLQDSEWVQAKLPEVAGLLWVLERMQVPHLPWWKKLWFRFVRIKVEPVTPPFDPAGLLPPPEGATRS